MGYGWLWLCECMGTRQPGCIHSPPADRRLSCGLVLDLDCGNHDNKLTVVFIGFYIIVRIIQGLVFLHVEPLTMRSECVRRSWLYWHSRLILYMAGSDRMVLCFECGHFTLSLIVGYWLTVTQGEHKGRPP